MAIATSYGAFIAGEWVHGEGGSEIEVRAPYDNSLVGAVTPASEAQVDAAVAAAKAAFPAWRRTPLRTRVELCRRAFDLCMERNEEIAEMIAREVGKTIREAREEMEEFTVDHFRRASEDVLRYAGSVPPSTQESAGTKRIMVVQEPIGVVAAISPWNFPVDIAGIPLVYGLALGCTTVWKPSEYAPICANMFVQLLHDAGFPPGTVNLVHGRGEIGAQLVKHPDVGTVVFTGLGRDRRARRPRRRPQEPRARAGRQRPADRVRRRRHRQGRRRRDHGLLLPRRAVLHGGRADPRPRVGEGPVRRRAGHRARAT